MRKLWYNSFMKFLMRHVSPANCQRNFPRVIVSLIHVLFLVWQALYFVQVFKEPLEKEPRGGSIISAEDIKTIFGRLPGILEVHNKIMVRFSVKRLKQTDGT